MKHLTQLLKSALLLTLTLALLLPFSGSATTAAGASGTGNYSLLYDRPDVPDVKIYTDKEREMLRGNRTRQSMSQNTGKVSELKKQNSDTIGWLRVQDTRINDPVLFETETKNTYYLRRNFNKEFDFNGSYYADYRSNFGTGLSNELARNTVIYGHSHDDDPDATQFSQLKKYRDFEFAKSHPYLYFSTDKEDMAFEIFAVFDAHVNFPYVHSVPTQGYTVPSILQAIRGASIYNYDVAVSETDKILTLSTCTYTVDGKPYQPATTEYRFVIMGRLVPKEEALKKEANCTVNQTPTHPDLYREVRQ